jgi:hypothetical protein
VLPESSAEHAAGRSTPGYPGNGPPSSTLTSPPFDPRPCQARCGFNFPTVSGTRPASLEFWYDPPGCALTDEELDLLRKIAAANAPVMFQAEGRTVPAHLAFDHRVDVLRDLWKAGWLVLEVWVAEPGNRGHARRRYSTPQAYCTESGRAAMR